MTTDETKPVSAWDKLNADVQERAGVEIADLPRKRTYLWVAKRTPLEVQMMASLLTSAGKPVPFDELLADLTPMVLSRHGDWPMNDDYLVAEMFDDGETDLLVYVVHKKDQTLGVRYRLNKACSTPTFGVDEMPMETWLDQLAESWKAVESDVDYEELATEEEREATLAYMRTLPKDYAISDLIADIEDENHLIEIEEPDGPGEEDDEDEDDEPEPAAAAAEPKPAATTPSATARTTEEATTPAGA
jgi:hypothetical protein